MASYSITVSLGSGEKGEKWKSALYMAAKKQRQSVGMFIRNCVRTQILKQEAVETAPEPKEKPEAAQ